MNYWTICQIQYIIDNYKTTTYATIGAHIGRNYNIVEDMAAEIGLRKRKLPEVQKRPARKRRRFPEGLRDWAMGGEARC